MQMTQGPDEFRVTSKFPHAGLHTKIHQVIGALADGSPTPFKRLADIAQCEVDRGKVERGDVSTARHLLQARQLPAGFGWLAPGSICARKRGNRGRAVAG